MHAENLMTSIQHVHTLDIKTPLDYQTLRGLALCDRSKIILTYRNQILPAFIYLRKLLGVELNPEKEESIY